MDAEDELSLHTFLFVILKIYVMKKFPLECFVCLPV